MKQADGLYLNQSESFKRKPLKSLARCLKSEQHDSGVVYMGGGMIKLQMVGMLGGEVSEKMNESSCRVYAENGLALTINTVGGGNLEPKVLCGEFNKKHPYKIIEIEKDGRKVGAILQDGNIYYVRKLTSRECLRLMGWTDGQIDKIPAAGVSNSQQYKQAGNGIVIQVLERIFEQMFFADKINFYSENYAEVNQIDFLKEEL